MWCECPLAQSDEKVEDSSSNANDGMRNRKSDKRQRQKQAKAAAAAAGGPALPSKADDPKKTQRSRSKDDDDDDEDDAADIDEFFDDGMIASYWAVDCAPQSHDFVSLNDHGVCLRLPSIMQRACS